MPIRIENRHLNALLDTGAGVSLLDVAEYNRMDHPPKLRQSSRRAVSVTGDPVSLYGECSLPVKMELVTQGQQGANGAAVTTSIVRQVPFVVADLAGDLCILGFRTLKGWHASIDTGRCVLEVPSGTVCLLEMGTEVMYRVDVTDQVKMRPGHMVTARVRVDNNVSGLPD